MISQRTRGLNSFFMLAQLTLVLVVYWVVFLIVDTFHSPVPNIKSYEVYCILIYVALLIEALRRMNDRKNLLQKDWLHDHHTALKQTLFASAVVVIFLAVTKDHTISRVFLATLVPVLYATLFVSSRLLPGILAQMTFRGIRQERTLLVGAASKIQDLKPWLDHKADFGISTIGLLSDETGAASVDEIRLLGAVDELEQVITDHSVTQVILIELPTVPKELQTITNICEQLGVRMLVLSDLESKFRHPITYFEDDGLLFIGLREEPLENPFNRALKRIVDICVSLPVIVFVLPIAFVIVWLFQRLQSPGSVFHIQERGGHQRRRFRILKFRTMHEHDSPQARQATQYDERIFPAARFFRKFSIDELPQFWNVLRGDMSVVGPRPHLLEHDQEFSSIMSNYHVRSFVKPGITGLAQVRGFRGETRTPEELVQRIQLDIYYLENWSLTVDLLIIVQTGWQVVVPPKSAY